MPRIHPLVFVGGCCAAMLALGILLGGRISTPVAAEPTPTPIADTQTAATNPSKAEPTRRPGDADSCIKVEDLKWAGRRLTGMGVNHCGRELDVVEIDLQLITGTYIADSVSAFGSNIPVGGAFSFDEPVKYDAQSVSMPYEPFVAAVKGR